MGLFKKPDTSVGSGIDRAPSKGLSEKLFDAVKKPLTLKPKLKVEGGKGAEQAEVKPPGSTELP